VSRSVTITEDGRSGRVRYSDGARAIDGYFEFGGGDVVAIVSMGSPGDWQGAHAWALHDRRTILQFVADEAIRQRAPSCRAEIDEARGDILLRTASMAERDAAPPPAAQEKAQAKSQAFVRRFTDLKAKLGAVVLVAALTIAALMWFVTNAFTVQPASGVPLGDAVRFASSERAFAGGIASLIQKTDPHLPRWSGRGGNDTTSISLLLIAIDGSTSRVIPVASKLTPNAYTLARIMGSDGRTLWFDVAGLKGVRLRDFKLITPQDLQAANRTFDASWWDDARQMDVVDGKLLILRPDRSTAIAIDPATLRAAPTPPVVSNARFFRDEPAHHLAAGVRMGPDLWLGLHSATELSGEFRAGRWIRPVENADHTRDMRRLYAARLTDASDGERRRIGAIAPLNDADYLNAAFLRLDDKAEPFRLRDPDSAVMIHTSTPGLAGTLVVSRTDVRGHLVWTVDTGLDRFLLRQILPGEDVLAFVGTRPPVPDKLSEPFVVLVETKTGKVSTQSLWR